MAASLDFIRIPFIVPSAHQLSSPEENATHSRSQDHSISLKELLIIAGLGVTNAMQNQSNNEEMDLAKLATDTLKNIGYLYIAMGIESVYLQDEVRGNIIQVPLTGTQIPISESIKQCYNIIMYPWHSVFGRT